MSARDAILSRARRAVLHKARHPGPHPPPGLAGGWPAFVRALAAAGGQAHGPVGREELAATLALLREERAPGERVVVDASAAPWVPESFGERAAPDATPHGFADVALAIVRGRVGCAENGAVAVIGDASPHRALFVLCRHLVLLLDEADVVPDFHAAHAALPEDALSHHHLTWLSGPSKTADIELTLVRGAHGPLSVDVVAVRG